MAEGHLNGSLTPSSGSVYTKSALTSSLRRSDDRPTWVVCLAISVTRIPQRDNGTPYKEVSVAARSCCPQFGWRPALRSLPRVVFGRRIARCHQIWVYEMRIREQLTGQSRVTGDILLTTVELAAVVEESFILTWAFTWRGCSRGPVFEH